MNVRLIVLMLLFCSHHLDCLIVGSNTDVSRQAFITFPEDDVDNEMRGFALFENGFMLASYLTTCSFNDVFPVTGDIKFRGGSLLLYYDFVLGQTVNVWSGGDIYGRGYCMEFPPQDSTFILPTDPSFAQFFLIDQEDTGNNVYEVAWTYDDDYLASGGDTVNPGDEINVYSFDGSSMVFKDGVTVDEVVLDVRWHPFLYYLAAAREVGIGNEVYLYYFDGSTLTLKDSEALGADATAVAWHPSGNYLAVGGRDDTQEIVIYSFSSVTELLTFKTSYNLNPNRDVVYAAMDWDPGGNYLAVGVFTDTVSPDLLIFYFDGSTLTLTVSQTFGRDASAVDWMPTGTYLAVGLGAGTESARVYEHNVSNGTLTEKTSARVGETASVYTIHWQADEEYLSIGTPNNPSGPEFKIYEFNKSTFTLTYVTGVETGQQVNTSRWSHRGFYVAMGDNTEYARIYNLSGPFGFLFDSISLVCNSDVKFQMPAKFRGNCLLDGRLHDLWINDSGLQVDYGSLLFLKNVTIKGVDSDTFFCFDNAGTFSLQNVTLVLDNDLSFSVGRIDVLEDVTMTGTWIFTYKSDQVSTIGSHATLCFDSGMTFSYASTAARNLIAMEDATSALRLNEATLYSVAPGLQLTKGTLILEGECPIMSDATTHDDGITLGDGSSADNDVRLKILTESGPYAMAGWFNYKNVN